MALVTIGEKYKLQKMMYVFLQASTEWKSLVERNEREFSPRGIFSGCETHSHAAFVVCEQSFVVLRTKSQRNVQKYNILHILFENQKQQTMTQVQCKSSKKCNMPKLCKFWEFEVIFILETVSKCFVTPLQSVYFSIFCCFVLFF